MLGVTAAAFDGGRDGEVIGGGRRGRRPFEGPRVPGIGAGDGAFEVRPDEVVDEDERADGLEEGAAGDDHVPDHPSAVGFVGIDTARHAEDSRNMHKVKREMEADEEDPEVPFAEFLIEHAAGYLRVPVVEGGENHEEDGADQDVVEVRDQEVGAAELPVEGGNREHDAGEAGDEELEEEADGEHHRRGEVDFAAPEGGKPVEDLDAGGHGDGHGGQYEEGVGPGGHADGEHVVGPDAEADEADANGGGDHRGITEDGFAREDGNDLVGEGEGRQDEDVDLGVAEDPEEVHPEDCGAAGLGIEEVGTDVAVEHEHDLRGSERADGYEGEAGGGEVEPHQQRQATEGHTGAAHAERGGDDVHRGADGTDAGEQDGEGPVVGAVAGRKNAGGERSVGEPADVGRAAGAVEAVGAEIAEVEQEAAERGDPEAEGVQTREGHVAGADHQRD